MATLKSATPQYTTKHVLIVSSHPLFGQGLKNLLENRKEADVKVAGIVSSIDQAMIIVEQQKVNFIIVDYDDVAVNKDDYLAHFVEGDQSLRLVLLSLQEGGSRAIVYDRQTLVAAQIDDWLRRADSSSSTDIGS